MRAFSILLLLVLPLAASFTAAAGDALVPCWPGGPKVCERITLYMHAGSTVLSRDSPDAENDAPGTMWPHDESTMGWSFVPERDWEIFGPLRFSLYRWPMRANDYATHVALRSNETSLASGATPAVHVEPDSPGLPPSRLPAWMSPTADSHPVEGWSRFAIPTPWGTRLEAGTQAEFLVTTSFEGSVDDSSDAVPDECAAESAAQGPIREGTDAALTALGPVGSPLQGVVALVTSGRCGSFQFEPREFTIPEIVLRVGTPDYPSRIEFLARSS